MKQNIFLFSLLIFLNAGLSSQIILSGRWAGVIKYEKGSCMKDSVECDVLLNNSSGNISGTIIYFVSRKGKSLDHITSFRGSFYGKKLIVKELSIDLQNPKPKLCGNCLMKGELVFSTSDSMLFVNGNWGNADDMSMTTCPAAKISFSKKGALIDPLINWAKEKNPEVAVYNRKVSVKEIISVSIPVVQITVWDPSKEDKDSINLNLNSKWILENYEVKKEPKTIRVELNTNDDNLLLMHAINEGQIPPNTATIKISDGKKEYIVRLSSSLKHSEVIQIKYVP